MKLLLVVLAILFLGSSYLLVSDFLITGEVVKEEERVFVTKVIDGDTIVANGEHIRLLGIDSDERGYPCYTLAKKQLEEWILNQEVVLETDVTDKDQYGRLLRYIILEGENINIRLVEDGLAVARFYKDRKYQKEILLAETTARENGVGCKWN